MDELNTLCSRCGEAFTCSVSAGEDDCWCMGKDESPPLPVPTNKDASCLCPECLRAARAKRAGVFSPL